MSAENVINLFSTGEIPRSKLFETLRQLERENVELKAEIKKLRSVVLTIQVLECDMHKLKGHECFAKHWALSLLDRVKRMKKGKTSK